MHKRSIFSAGLVFISFLVPAFASAATITSVTINGGSSAQVNPGDNIIVSVTTTLGAKEKWKGTDWGINTTNTTSSCANSRNSKDHEYGDNDDRNRGDRDERLHDGHTFTEVFIAKAPKAPGLYGIATAVDAKNRCGDPISPVFALPQSIRVGTNTVPPTFAPYSDIVVQLTSMASGTAVTYPLPTATDLYGNAIAVSCTPASGSYFPVGNDTVMCSATDNWGNQATPEIFTVSVLLPPDVTPPVISPVSDISVQSTSASGIVVTFATPTATDDRDGTDPVSCTPASGSTFTIGTTTVTCTATDAAGNTATSTFNVGVTAPVTTVDTVPPVIASSTDITVVLTTATATSSIVTYTVPTATDNVDGSVPVSCTPASGSTFGLGTTTVTCTAQDAAGNVATSTFGVGVYPFVSQMVVLASQPDESYLCATGWRDCFTGGASTYIAKLGLGSGLQAGALLSASVSLDPTYNTAPGTGGITDHPWTLTISCFTDAAYSVPCTDWVAGNPHNANQNNFVFEQATSTTDIAGKHWTAYFTNPNNESNFSGGTPVTFNPADYYQLQIDDNGVGWPAFGSQSLGQPYWVINGITQ